MNADELRAHLRAHFGGPDPQSASVTFLGVEPIDVLRFPRGDMVHYVSAGCSRHAMGDDSLHGPRAEVVVTLRGAGQPTGLARSVAMLAAAPAVEGLILTPDALVDLGQRLWDGSVFTAFLLADSDIPAVGAVVFLRAVPITATEAAWVRLKGADAMRHAWEQDGVDVSDPRRPASSAGR